MGAAGPSSNGQSTADQRSLSQARACWILLVVFTLLAVVTMLRHEMWRDEIHAWQAVVSADSPLEVMENVRYEGHPALWFAMLYPPSRVTSDPRAVQVIHLCVAVGVAALVLCAAPLPLLWRGLFVLGYFPLFEYCAVSRNYAVGALFLFLFCALYPARYRRPLMAVVVLVLLAQASVYGLMLCFVMGLVWFVDDIAVQGDGRRGGGRLGLVFAVWAVGLLASVAQIIGARFVMHPLSPEKAGDAVRILDVLATPWRGYVPLPRFRDSFWNTYFLDGVGGGELLQVVLGLVLIGVLASLFIGRRSVLLGYLIGSTGLVAFAFFIYVGHARHHGHHLLLLLACLWIWSAGTDDRAGARTVPRRHAVLIPLLLAVNVVAGGYAVLRDWRDPFSSGKETAEFIRTEGLADLPIVGHRDVLVATVGAYLQRPIYYPTLGREVVFITWGAAEYRNVDDEEAFRQARLLGQTQNSDVLLVLSQWGHRRPQHMEGARRIARFPKSIVRTERYELYLLEAETAADDSR